jgi:hypothetical protein
MVGQVAVTRRGAGRRADVRREALMLELLRSSRVGLW